MKKILSIVAAFTMVATMMSSFVASAAVTPTADVTATVMTNDEFYAVAEMDIPEGYVMYNVTVDLSDFGTLNRTKEGLKYSGRKLKVAQIDLLGLGEYADKDMTMVMSNCFDQTVSEGFDGTKFTAAYASAGEATAYPLSAAEGITTVDDVYSVLVGVPSTESFEIDYAFTYSFTTYSKGTPGTSEEGTVTGTVTFGESAPVVDDVWTSDEVPSIEAGKKVVAHSENVTVTADSRVEITVDGTSRLFGSAIGEYLAKKDIILDGEATANVRFALLVNEAANEITFNVVD